MRNVVVMMIRWFAIVLACSGAQAGVRQPAGAAPDEIGLDTVATGLDVPWAMAFAPDGRIFVTERSGVIRVIENGKLLPSAWARVAVDESGEDGLMGIALAPDFAASHHVFIVRTGKIAEGAKGDLTNSVIRYTDRDGKGVEPKAILERIPSNSLHAGDAIAFGPDGMLYVATGDARSPSRAQDRKSLGGKILRLNPDGTIPKDNPDPSSPVYAKGFRNVQGLAWDRATGQLFATEHGPSGFANELFRRDNDELNAVKKGGNFGWPVVAGSLPGPYINPIAVWTPGIAPSGLAIYDGAEFPEWKGNLFVGALRGQQLRRIVVSRDGDRWRVVSPHPLFEGRLGRIRAVAYSPDGHLYFTTSNRDGRGTTRPNDDRIFRVVRRP